MLTDANGGTATVILADVVLQMELFMQLIHAKIRF
jgi:hypothetical protein